MILLEDNAIHVYQDRDTGERFYYNGKRLISFDRDFKSPVHQPDEEEMDEIDRWHEEQLKKDMEEHPEYYVDDEEITDESEEERKEILKKYFSSPEEFEKIEKENKKAIEKEKEEIKKLKASNEARLFIDSGNLEQFSIDINRLVKTQIAKLEKSTFKKENPRYENTGIVKPTKTKYDNPKVPVVNVYFDQSISWTSDDVRRGMDAIGILNKYVDKGKLEINVLYFSDGVHENREACRAEGGTRAMPKVLRHIQQTRPKNVVIMTDHDPDGQGDWSKSVPVTVPGGVYLLFKGGDESRKVQDFVRGTKVNRKYSV